LIVLARTRVTINAKDDRYRDGCRLHDTDGDALRFPPGISSVFGQTRLPRLCTFCPPIAAMRSFEGSGPWLSDAVARSPPAASLWLDAGAPFEYVRDQLAHADLRTTQKDLDVFWSRRKSIRRRLELRLQAQPDVGFLWGSGLEEQSASRREIA